MILDYATAEQFSTFIETLNSLEQLLNTAEAEEVCRQAAGYYICNYVFIPCNLTTGNPRPICSASCDRYFNIRCVEVFGDILEFSSTFIDYPFMNNCPNTLSHLEDFGLSFMSGDFTDDCIDLVGMHNIATVSLLSMFCHLSPAIIEPGLETRGDNNTASVESSSNNNSIPVIVVSVVCGLLAIVIVSFLVVVFLIIRRKRKTNKYKKSDMMPSEVAFSQRRYVSITN